ncbi:dihydroxyacetone kinase subunit DhaL [Vibrio sp. SCSIO 43137]|uniref:dihydroxyacetone kinase subunit DhaL n=1 Tax=Vibrio sp. SCSIO 43137 TaxID=3021011 RepID=UPI002307AC0A|nr:dihydroxyacetone kinase subunit DhaL [Vibrio sp. SCSIO 43137]WCE31738.1 dihydroxyacetone kinase subunit DhaL [Vibrio sp. SCSIO 43137]
MTIEKAQILQWLEDCSVLFAEQQDYLTQLDADIGDADHGLNMNRGFVRVAEKVPTMQKQSIGTILKTTGMTLMSSVGGASGPLYGTFFIRAAGVVDAKESLNSEDLTAMLRAGMEGLVARGKAEAGDKTMCDVWFPVVEACENGLAQGSDVNALLDNIVAVAEEGVHATIALQARKGRASYLGERSVGHQDPGATSSMMMLKSLHKVVLGGS